MRTLACTIGIIALLATPALAASADYGWEGTGTLLGMYPAEGVIPSLVTDPVHGGNQSLQLVDNADSGTPQAFIAWITGLEQDDEVYASVYRYDDTPGASPSCRIWGSYTSDPNDITSYHGSAGGNSDYGLGEGWDMTDHTWTFNADGGNHDGLVIQIRTYSVAGDTVWVDDLHIDAPDHATIHLVPEPTSLLLLGLAGLLIRRR